MTPQNAGFVFLGSAHYSVLKKAVQETLGATPSIYRSTGVEIGFKHRRATCDFRAYIHEQRSDVLIHTALETHEMVAAPTVGDTVMRCLLSLPLMKPKNRPGHYPPTGTDIYLYNCNTCLHVALATAVVHCATSEERTRADRHNVLPRISVPDAIFGALQAMDPQTLEAGLRFEPEFVCDAVSLAYSGVLPLQGRAEFVSRNRGLLLDVLRTGASAVEPKKVAKFMVQMGCDTPELRYRVQMDSSAAAMLLHGRPDIRDRRLELAAAGLTSGSGMERSR